MPLKNLGVSVAMMVLPWVAGSLSSGATVRVVDWNIEADINNATTPRAGFNTVLQGMGNEVVAGNAQPLDILALEETTSNAATVTPIVNDLNSDYGAGTYAMSSLQGGDSGGTNSGNGPNALVYDTKTVSLVASLGIGTPLGSSNGEYRQVMRYEFIPVGGSSPFYIYVSHAKSGTTSSDATDRGKEATIIRNDQATLPASSSVIYSGDLNSSPPEAEFTNYTAPGQGQAFDPVSFSTSVQYYSESSTNLRYRDDYQLMTSNVLNDTAALNYVSGSLHAFGNNGSVGVNGRVDSGSNTALAYMTAANGYSPTQSQILSALTTASDHLPNVADYTVAVPEPTIFAIVFGMAGMSMDRRRRTPGANGARRGFYSGTAGL